MTNGLPTEIRISALTVIKIIAILAGAYLLYLVRDILVVFFVALIFASALDPWVNWLQTKKVPRVAAVLAIYVVLFGAASGIVYLLIPPIIAQVKDLSDNFPYYFERATSGFEVAKSYSLEHGLSREISQTLDLVRANLTGAASGVLTALINIFGGIVSFFLIIVITFYMVVEEKAVKKIVWSVAPPSQQLRIMQLVNRMQKKIGLWLRGQLILSLIIFVLLYTGLKAFGLKYALVLALFAGLTEFVPYLGPTLAAVPAIFLAFTQAPMLALFVAGLYYIVQMVENHVIVPKLMQRVVGLNPVVIIAVMLIGFKLGGVPGAILSIPVATAAFEAAEDIFGYRPTGKEALSPNQ